MSPSRMLCEPEASRPYLGSNSAEVHKLRAIGITHDLEQLQAKGVASVLLVNSGQHADAFRENGPAFLSPGWRELYRHGLAKAARLGIAVDVNMAPSWNMGGKSAPPQSARNCFLNSFGDVPVQRENVFEKWNSS